ncbi:MAG: hypothetical protein A3G34_07130 [Candidatus Lindowbacteria bacterium RIFCSPLOWO2_12_FULL_62_27]|nr:MAG: hypothetical protein A3G34_07130 [Candidatus Lindowbacteria bacterium RIFCSPLOWO2_12_FULL_62_27]OGH61807.1 MAG: hypothetical protein A3I06_09315 [Candidatus Lindowbacteria bacterium RIFCSPLOWO2_02_FULL_62_12]
MELIHESEAPAWLVNLDLELARRKDHLTAPAAMQKFRNIFKDGFDAPSYTSKERDYKWTAHCLWNDSLNREEYTRLLSNEEWEEIVVRALAVEAKTNLLSPYEKMPLRDALKTSAAAKTFCRGLYDLIYGDDGFENRFDRFTGTLEALPQPKSSTVKWPIQTFFPFIAMPGNHLFLKPEVTNQAAERRGYQLNYKSEPNWLTYSCLLKFARIVKDELVSAGLNPRDMIDIQSYIWVTGDDTY